jgi:hypothetical protein
MRDHLEREPIEQREDPPRRPGWVRAMELARLDPGRDRPFEEALPGEVEPP